MVSNGNSVSTGAQAFFTDCSNAGQQRFLAKFRAGLEIFITPT
jgi:hypothetical protein